MKRPIKKLLLLITVPALLLMQSCGNKEKSKETTNDTTTVALAPPLPLKPTVVLPVFEQNFAEIKKYFGTSLKNPKKFIIRIEFADFNTPNSKRNKLLLYPADSHTEYGKDQEPLEIPATAETVEIGSNLIIGNNEFDANKKLLRTPEDGNTLKEFTVIRFIPQLSEESDGKKNHLSFIVKLIKADKSETDLGGTKPSPPAPPDY